MLTGYRGIASALVALIAEILRATGAYEMAPDEQEKIVEGILTVITFGGIILSIFFSWLKNKREKALKKEVRALGGDPTAVLQDAGKA